MTRRSRFAALVAVVALAAAGCSNNDAKESDVVGAMEDAGLDSEQAECVGAAMQDEYGGDQDLFNEVASAENIDDLPDGAQETIESILDNCVAGEGSGSTDTTEAGDDSTSTTGADAATTTTAGG
jgi:hypothetical protein